MSTTISVRETERRSREQGYYFGVQEIRPRWEQFGHVMWHDVELARAHGLGMVARHECAEFVVCRCSLVAPYESVVVES